MGGLTRISRGQDRKTIISVWRRLLERTLLSAISASLRGILREGNGNPLQHSCLETPRDGGAWWAAVHGVAKSRTQLSNFTFTFHFHALEKEMATHSSVFAWRIPGTGEPGGLLSTGSHRVGHDWSDLAAATARGILTYWGMAPYGRIYTPRSCHLTVAD